MSDQLPWEQRWERRRTHAREVADFLDAEAGALFDAGVFHQDEYGTFSANEDQSLDLQRAAELLRDLYPLDEEMEGAE